MKKLLLALCLLISSHVFAIPQKDTVIHVDTLYRLGAELTKGWKFHPGDNPAFARVDYDDHHWQSINPTLKSPDLPKAAQQGLGWLRLHFSVAPALRQKALLQIQNAPALEVYLDGELIARHGTIDPLLKTGRAYTTPEPIVLQLSNDSVHVLAIRFANQANIGFMNGYNADFFVDVSLADTQTVRYRDATYESFHLILGVCASILMLLALILLTLFYYNPAKRANLYSACYSFLLGSNAISIFYYTYRASFYDTYVYSTILSNAISLAGEVMFVKALASLFNFKTGRPFVMLVVLTAASCLIYIFTEALGVYPYWVAFVLLSVAQLWLTVKAVYLKKRGAPIIAVGLLISLVTGIIVAYLLISNNNYTEWGWTLFQFVYLATILSPALAISLFLSHEFALDGRLLKLKLEQVEELSAQTLAQEQEKQQILADQNIVLEQQVTERTAELNRSLTNLKATQTQLIQSEKMASLGELTAGIAHEIQNPLNFVNNFSEVSVELLEELKEEVKAGHNEDVIAIAADLSQNLEKINHHGKRADAIVKGMLQHSQVGSGSKEPTNINAIADECMRLSYHGVRSKDKSFNAEMVTHFDSALPKINVIPQDIVRVMLNLFNNAFYAVNQKQKKAGDDYRPEVSVTTSSENYRVIIKVKDNGIGIPDAIKDKIMQPFFTTKPTGEGTGLGLSLTYDMVVKGHGGSIEVDTKEGEYTEFTIKLSTQ